MKMFTNERTFVFIFAIHRYFIMLLLSLLFHEKLCQHDYPSTNMPWICGWQSVVTNLCTTYWDYFQSIEFIFLFLVLFFLFIMKFWKHHFIFNNIAKSKRVAGFYDSKRVASFTTLSCKQQGILCLESFFHWTCLVI